MKKIDIKNDYYFITEENIKDVAICLCPEWGYDKIKARIDNLTSDDLSIIESCVEETFRDGKYDVELGLERGLNEVWDLDYGDDDDEV